MPYVIYKVTNTVNGKCYIGLTTDPTRRFQDCCPHVEAARKYQVSVANVRAIRYGKSWKNLDRSLAPAYSRASQWDVNSRQATASA